MTTEEHEYEKRPCLLQGRQTHSRNDNRKNDMATEQLQLKQLVFVAHGPIRIPRSNQSATFNAYGLCTRVGSLHMKFLFSFFIRLWFMANNFRKSKTIAKNCSIPYINIQVMTWTGFGLAITAFPNIILIIWQTSAAIELIHLINPTHQSVPPWYPHLRAWYIL